MNLKDKALKMAIVALESSGGKFFDKEINACKEALEQPAQPLSDDEVWENHDKTDSDNWVIDFARAIEQAHGIGVKE